MAMFKTAIKLALKNKVVLFVISRYGTYFIHFINSLFIAVYLGPYYLGIWGFVSLMTKNLYHLNLGISHAVTAIISVHKSKEFYVQKVIGTALTLLMALSFLVALFFLANEVFSFNFGAKYNFSVYAPVVLLIGVLSYFNSLFTSIFRVYGRLFEMDSSIAAIIE